jgi:thioredoxin-related protein
LAGFLHGTGHHNIQWQMTTMKYLLGFTIVLFAFCAKAQDANINWMTIEEAVEAQKEEPRKIMIDVYTQWCGPCKMMDRNTFHNADVASYVNENYYAVKFDAESPDDVQFKGRTFTNPTFDPAKVGRRNGVNEFARALQVSAYPTVVFLDEDLNMLAPIRGYQTPPQFELYLKFFAKDEHKNIDTQEEWNAYQQAFEPTW